MACGTQVWPQLTISARLEYMGFSWSFVTFAWALSLNTSSTWLAMERPLFVAIRLWAMSIGHTLISLGLPEALYVRYILIGVCYGSQWSLMPTITAEIFGLWHFGIGSYIQDLYTTWKQHNPTRGCASVSIASSYLKIFPDCGSSFRIGVHRCFCIVPWNQDFLSAGDTCKVSLFHRIKVHYKVLLVYVMMM